MKPDTQSAVTRTDNRRNFLKGFGALGAGSLLCSSQAFAEGRRDSHRFELSVEATLEDFSLVWPTPQLPQLDPGLIVRVRIEYPVRRHDLLEWQTFVASETSPRQPLVMVTLFRMRVDQIGVSGNPNPNFGLFGQIVENPVVDNPDRSPFGDLTGATAMVCGGFDAPGEHTTFTFLGGAAAGSHASALRTATGLLRIGRGWC